MNVRNDAALHIMSICSAVGDVGNVIWCITALAALHNATGCFMYAIQQNKPHAVHPHNHRGPLIHRVVDPSITGTHAWVFFFKKKDEPQLGITIFSNSELPWNTYETETAIKVFGLHRKAIGCMNNEYKSKLLALYSHFFDKKTLCILEALLR
jgi:hypothetical protein